MVNKSSLHILKTLSKAHKIAIDKDQFLCSISVYETNPAEESGIPDFFLNKDVRVCRYIIILAQNVGF